MTSDRSIKHRQHSIEVLQFEPLLLVSMVTAQCMSFPHNSREDNSMHSYAIGTLIALHELYGMGYRQADRTEKSDTL